MTNKNYMTVKEAAQLWGVTPDTVRRWCKTGQIIAVPEQDGPGKPWRIPYGAKRVNKKKAGK